MKSNAHLICRSERCQSEGGVILDKTVKTIGLFALGTVLAVAPALGQQDDKRPRIDVDNYTIDVQINPDTQTLTARAAVRFVPLDDRTNSATFELNNALIISRITDEQGQTLQSSRNQQD